MSSRLDRALSERFPGHSRSALARLIEEGHVRIDGRPAKKPSQQVEADQRIEVDFPEPAPSGVEAQDLPLKVLFEDADLVVIDKPAGLVVHPAAGHRDGTLVNALLFTVKDLSGIGGEIRPGIVHRLDKDTSGVMVVAKTDTAHRALSDAFADHGRAGELERAYEALVWGAPARNTGSVDAPLGRARDRVLRAVVPQGRDDARHAVTHYTVLQRFPAAAPEAMASLVECRLETGRTHQIRVHMAHIGHPVIGDPDYGKAFRTKANRLPEPLRTAVAGFPRQALHARLLAFRHPRTHMIMRFEAPMPADMAAMVTEFRALRG